MKKTTRRGHSTLTELNITPLLDLVFVLLVIFIITTPQMINSLKMVLPSGDNKPKPQNTNDLPKINRIQVDDEGKVFLNSNFVSDDQISNSLYALKLTEDAPKVVVKGTDVVEYQNVVKVLDALQQSGITNVGLATQ
jgi:biopolymer transport protein ExbD